MGNVHFYEIADWLLSWFTLDLAGDDLVTYYAKQRRARKEAVEELKQTPGKKAPPAGLAPPPPKGVAPPPKPSPTKPPASKRPAKVPAKIGKYRLEDLIP